jgi:hypothetical protein
LAEGGGVEVRAHANPKARRQHDLERLRWLLRRELEDIVTLVDTSTTLETCEADFVGRGDSCDGGP